MQCSGSGQNNECHPYFAGAEAGPDLERPNVRYHHGYSDAYIIFTAYILRAHVLAHVNLLNICSFDSGNLKMMICWRKSVLLISHVLNVTNLQEYLLLIIMTPEYFMMSSCNKCNQNLYSSLWGIPSIKILTSYTHQFKLGKSSLKLF